MSQTGRSVSGPIARADRLTRLGRFYAAGPMQGLHDWHDYRCVPVFDYFSLLSIVACSRFDGYANIIQRMTYAKRFRSVFAQQA
ncbi:MAG: hypothetical protein ABSH35_25485 [Isosphaeraceae bacterium]